MLFMKNTGNDTREVIVRKEDVLSVQDIKDLVDYLNDPNNSEEDKIKYKANIVAHILLDKAEPKLYISGYNLKDIMLDMYNKRLFIPKNGMVMAALVKLLSFWTMDMEEYEENGRDMLVSMRNIRINTMKGHITITDTHIHPRLYSIDELVNMHHKTNSVNECIDKLLNTPHGKRVLDYFYFA